MSLHAVMTDAVRDCHVTARAVAQTELRFYYFYLHPQTRPPLKNVELNSRKKKSAKPIVRAARRYVRTLRRCG